MASSGLRHPIRFDVQAQSQGPGAPLSRAAGGRAPVGPDLVARRIERDFTPAYFAGQAILDVVFDAGFRPRLEAEIVRVAWRSAKIERDDVIEFIFAGGIDRLTGGGQALALERVGVAGRRSDGLCPAGRAYGRPDRFLANDWVDRDRLGDGRE